MFMYKHTGLQAKVVAAGVGVTKVREPAVEMHSAPLGYEWACYKRCQSLISTSLQMFMYKRTGLHTGLAEARPAAAMRAIEERMLSCCWFVEV